jgi:hypothetical protein
MDNKTLSTISENIKAKLDANMQDAFERFVVAGMKFLYKDDRTHAMSMQAIEESENKAVGVGEGVATIMMLLNQKARGKLPWEAGVAAGYALVCEALDFVEQKYGTPIDNTTIDTAMKAYAEKLMTMMKINDKTIGVMQQEAQKHAQDPRVRQAYKQKFGQEIPS